MKEKTYKLKKCPKCKAYDKIGVVIGQIGVWNCGCGWQGEDPEIIDVSADEFLKYVDEIESQRDL